MPLSNLSVTAKYLPPLPIGGSYLSGYGALENQFPVVYDVSFLLNYYGKTTVLVLHIAYSGRAYLTPCYFHKLVHFISPGCRSSTLKTRTACLHGVDVC